jgi:hypothetical protein
MNFPSIKKSLLFFLSIFLLTGVYAQKNERKMKKKYDHDVNYYEMFANKITARVYVGQKSSHVMIPSSTGAKDINYEANHKLNLGFGLTHHNYSLNVGYGFSAINPDTKLKGKTKGLDFQFHLYPHKWAVDLMLVMPKGMYIDPKGYGASNPGLYYFRNDIKERLLGVAAYKVPNKAKFSYRAAIVQNEWQKKSAGSPLYGAEVYYGSITGDSALVPDVLEPSFSQDGMTKMRYFTIGPGVGYAYTLVIEKHFYIMASLIGNVKLNMVTETFASGDLKKTSIAPSAIVKTGIGYNSDNWSVGANLTGNGLWIKGKTSNGNYYVPSGAFRIQVAKKFNSHSKK